MMFWIVCPDRQTQGVEWSFRMLDGEGHATNVITKRVACSPDPLPGSAPRLEEVRLRDRELVLGWTTEATVRVSGTHPPFRVRARRLSGPDTGDWVSTDRATTWLSIACADDRGPHQEGWRFTVTDSYGRTSAPIVKVLACGVCR